LRTKQAEKALNQVRRNERHTALLIGSETRFGNLNVADSSKSLEEVRTLEVTTETKVKLIQHRHAFNSICYVRLRTYCHDDEAKDTRNFSV